MIDSHCHLDFDVFDGDRDEVVKNANALGVKQFLLPGTTADTWQRQLNLCKQYESFYAALGLHPYFLSTAQENDLSRLDELLTKQPTQIIALGEMGIDGAIDVPMDKQKFYFSAQIELATKHALPLVIHHRQSHQTIVKMLKQQSFKHGGVIHAFSGSLQQAHEYINLGFMLGAGGTITYERGQKTRNTFQEIALEHILLETDSPDMPLSGFQGQRNEPSRLPIVAEHLARLKGVDVEEVLIQTNFNFARLFFPSSAS